MPEYEAIQSRVSSALCAKERPQSLRCLLLIAFDVRILQRRVYCTTLRESDAERGQNVGSQCVWSEPWSEFVDDIAEYFFLTTCDMVFARQELRLQKRTLCSCKGILFSTSAGEVGLLHATEIDTLATVFKQVRGDVHRECRLQLTSKTCKDL